MTPPHLVLRVVIVLAHKRLWHCWQLSVCRPEIFSTAHVFEKSFIRSNSVFGFPCTPFPSTTDAVSRAGLGATTPLQKATSFRSSSKAFASEITLTETAQQRRTGWSQHHLPMCILHPARTTVGTTVYKNLE